MGSRHPRGAHVPAGWAALQGRRGQGRGRSMDNWTLEHCKVVVIWLPAPGALFSRSTWGIRRRGADKSGFSRKCDRHRFVTFKGVSGGDLWRGSHLRVRMGDAGHVSAVTQAGAMCAPPVTCAAGALPRPSLVPAVELAAGRHACGGRGSRRPSHVPRGPFVRPSLLPPVPHPRRRPAHGPFPAPTRGAMTGWTR